MATLSSRAHELKGLAGNFGMKSLSMLAGDAEKFARMAKQKDALKAAKGLRDMNTQTRKALDKWVKDQDV